MSGSAVLSEKEVHLDQPSTVTVLDSVEVFRP